MVIHISDVEAASRCITTAHCNSGDIDPKILAAFTNLNNITVRHRNASVRERMAAVQERKCDLRQKEIEFRQKEKEAWASEDPSTCIRPFGNLETHEIFASCGPERPSAMTIVSRPTDPSPFNPNPNNGDHRSPLPQNGTLDESSATHTAVPAAEYASGCPGENQPPTNSTTLPPAEPVPAAAPRTPEEIAQNVEAYTDKRAQEYRAYRRHICGWPATEPEPEFITDFIECPCGSQLPCPDHEPFHDSFWTADPYGIFYWQSLAERGMPYTQPKSY